MSQQICSFMMHRFCFEQAVSVPHWPHKLWLI